MNQLKAGLLLLGFFWANWVCFAHPGLNEFLDDEKPKSKYPVEVTLDLARQKLSEPMPFDVPFYVCGSLPDELYGSKSVTRLTFFLAPKGKNLRMYSSSVLIEINNEIEELEDNRKKKAQLFTKSDSAAYSEMTSKLFSEGNISLEDSILWKKEEAESLFTRKDSIRLDSLKQFKLVWEKVGSWQNLGLTEKSPAGSQDFCVAFPPLPANQEFVLKVEVRTSLKEDPKQQELVKSIDDILRNSLNHEIGGATIEVTDPLGAKGYNKVAKEIARTISAFSEESCLEVDRNYDPCGKGVAAKQVNYQRMLVEREFWLDIKKIREQRPAVKAAYEIAQNTLDNFGNAVNKKNGEMLPVINVIRDNDFGKENTKAVEALNGVYRLGAGENPRRYRIANGTSTVSKFPVLLHDIKLGKIWDPSACQSSINNLELSIQQLTMLEYFVRFEFLSSKSRRVRWLYKVGKNDKIRTKDLLDFGFVLTAQMAAQDSISYHAVDDLVKRNFERFIREISNVKLELLSVKNEVAELRDDLQEFKRNRGDFIKEILSGVLLTGEISPIIGGTGVDFVTRGKYYITADAGFAFAPGLGAFVPYAGVNFNLAALNREAKYSIFRKARFSKFQKKGIGLLKNTSIVVGIVPYNTSAFNSRYSNLWAETEVEGIKSLNLLTGLGFRINDGVRFSMGAIWFKRIDANPLLTPRDLAPAPYGSLSLDLDLAKYARNLFGFFKKVPDSN